MVLAEGRHVWYDEVNGEVEARTTGWLRYRQHQRQRRQLECVKLPGIIIVQILPLFITILITIVVLPSSTRSTIIMRYGLLCALTHRGMAPSPLDDNGHGDDDNDDGDNVIITRMMMGSQGWMRGGRWVLIIIVGVRCVCGALQHVRYT